MMFSQALPYSKILYVWFRFKIHPKHGLSQSYDPYFGSKPPTSKNPTEHLRHPINLIPLFLWLSKYLFYGKIIGSGVSARWKLKKRIRIISLQIFQIPVYAPT